MIQSHRLSQRITTPTRVSQTTKTIIDVVYIKSNKNISPFVIPIALSDHFLVGCSRYLAYKKDPATHYYGRSYTLEKARAYYASLDKSFIFQINNVDLAWKAVHPIVLNCANKLSPIKRISTRVNQPPWITKEILELLADRD